MVDANILLAALLRDNTTRQLVLDPRLRLFAPEWLRVEIERHSDLIAKRSAPAAAHVLAVLESRIVWIPDELLRARMADLRTAGGGPDAKDVPYVAATRVVDGVLWTHDKRLRATAGVPLASTAEILAGLQGRSP